MTTDLCACGCGGKVTRGTFRRGHHMKNLDHLERFWSQVEKTGTCWLWLGRLNEDRYGLFSFNYRNAFAHRHAYELEVGPIAEGLQLDHLCRVRHCVNPAHLEAVTPRVNTLRGEGLSAINAKKVRCDHGHEFAPDNTYIYNGDRLCRTCRRIRNREWRARARRARERVSS